MRRKIKNGADVALVRILNLRPRDLAEIAGHTDDRHARDVFAGKTNLYDDTLKALQLMFDDIEAMEKMIIANCEENGTDQITIFRNNAELRETLKGRFARGFAEGAFIGPHSIAVHSAFLALQDKGVDVKIQFPD